MNYHWSRITYNNLRICTTRTSSSVCSYICCICCSFICLKIRNSANNGWLVLGSLTDAAHTNNFGLATKASPDFTGTIDSAGDIVMGGTGALKLPSGTTVQRPTAATGQIRFKSCSYCISYIVVMCIAHLCNLLTKT